MLNMLPRPTWCVVCLWLCYVTSQDATQNVTGPPSLVTDGTRNLTLTCPNSSVPVERYRWLTPGSGDYDINRCNTKGPVCTFQPKLDDDKKNVSCTAYNATGHVLHQAFYLVNLNYPPETSPVIMTEPPGKHTLKQGDNITCTVSGGKPRVTNVTFHCDPEHQDQENDVSDDGRNVSSSITVNTSVVTNVNLKCTCSAYWEPRPGLYTHKTQREFILGTPGEKGLSTGAVAGIVGGSVVVFLILLISILICVCFAVKKKRKAASKSQEGLENPSMAMGNIYSEPYAAQIQAQGRQGTHHNTVSSPSPYEDVQADDYDHLGRLKAPPRKPDPTYSHTNAGFVMS